MGGLSAASRPARVTKAMAGALLGALVLSAPVALAMPGFRLSAIRQFHYDQGNPLWEYDRRVMACTYCHVNPSGGAPWNPFGEAVRATFRADAQAGRHRKFPDVLYTLLASDRDADKDGYSDVLEVFARTLPGDPASKPVEPLTQVRAAFDQAGGIKQYAPPKTKAPVR